VANDKDVALLKQGVAAWNVRRRRQGMEALFHSEPQMSVRQ
jgi:hypothetical protein